MTSQEILNQIAKLNEQLTLLPVNAPQLEWLKTDIDQKWEAYEKQVKKEESLQSDETVKKLQKTLKAYKIKEIAYDVYSDRVNFIGSNEYWLVNFFAFRGIIADKDRSGYSVDIEDAKLMGFPVEAKGYRIKSDLRKKAIEMN